MPISSSRSYMSSGSIVVARSRGLDEKSFDDGRATRPRARSSLLIFDQSPRNVRPHAATAASRRRWLSLSIPARLRKGTRSGRNSTMCPSQSMIGLSISARIAWTRARSSDLVSVIGSAERQHLAVERLVDVSHRGHDPQLGKHAEPVELAPVLDHLPVAELEDVDAVDDE